MKTDIKTNQPKENMKQCKICDDKPTEIFKGFLVYMGINKKITKPKETMKKNITDVLKPTEKTYIINNRKYIAITDFIKNRLSVKCYNGMILLTETLDNYTNNDGLNMEGYINKLVKEVKQIN